VPHDIHRRQKAIRRLLGPFPDPEDNADRPFLPNDGQIMVDITVQGDLCHA